MSDAQYDAIIIGAGSAGAALAYRLTEDAKVKVLLLEAGPRSHWMSRIPISFGKLLDDPKANWCYESEPEENTSGRAIPVPRGRLLGGSSAINGLVYVRGQPLDYDTWGQLGNRGWSYDDVAPTFRRMEDFEGGGSDVRGAGGPLHVSEAPDASPLYDALFKAGQEVGHARNPDYNGLDQEGLCKTQTTIKGGRRMSTAYCYLRPAANRPNLRVETEALAHGLIFEGKRCVGVRYEQHGQMIEARAGREVILCGGAVNSPQLLELSGIGRPDVLNQHGINILHEIPGVGENLRDHIAPRTIWKITQPKVTYNDRARGLGLAWHALRYVVTRTGFMNLPSAPMLGFLKTQPHLATPDLQLHFVPFMVRYTPKRELAPEPGVTITLYQLRPESLGSIHIKSANPKDHPAIRFNFLDNKIDRRCLLDGVKMVREIMHTSAMDSFRGEEVAPGVEKQTDDEVLQWIRDTADTAYHPISTCRMGPDPMSVVDERLKVRGIEGLRVADASIMPTMVSGNTNAASIMIGEKASDLIREDWAASA